MLIATYQLSLPRSFDLDELRQRIPGIGVRFDHLPGLAAKAFLVRDTGVDGAPLKQYAPFYLFTDEAAAAALLWEGQEFSGVVAAYGRPVVQTWLGAAYQRGPAIGETPTWAVRTVRPLPADAPPATTAERLRSEAVARAAEPGLHSVAAGIDPRGWETVVFSMHTREPDPRGGELYEVVHLSAPHEALLASAS